MTAERKQAGGGAVFLMGLAGGLVLYSVTAQAVAAGRGSGPALPSAAAVSEDLSRSDASSAVERFKAFLASPPVIESLVFSERLAPDPTTPWRTDIPLSASQAFRFYHARWQPNALFLRELPGPGAVGDLKTPGLLAVRFNDECWFHYGHGYEEQWLDFGVSVGNQTNLVYQAAHENIAVLRQVLNLGIMHAEVGTAEWNGNRFRIRQPTRDYQITGELRPSSAGLVESLRVTYASRDRDIHYLVRYGYQTESLPGGLPRVISCFWLNEGKEVQRDEFTLQKLTTRTAPLERPRFAPDQIGASNGWQLRFFTNEAMYVVAPGGKLQLVGITKEGVTPKGFPGKPARSELAVVYSVCAGANAWIFILAVRMKRRHNKNLKPKTV